MTVVLLADRDIAFILVALTVISSTTIGAFTGGILTTKLLGSYTNPKTIYLCLVMFSIMTFASLPLSFLTPSMVYVFIGLVWLIMFCHGFIEPIMTGILLN